MLCYQSWWSKSPPSASYRYNIRQQRAHSNLSSSGRVFVQEKCVSIQRLCKCSDSVHPDKQQVELFFFFKFRQMSLYRCCRRSGRRHEGVQQRCPAKCQNNSPSNNNNKNYMSQNALGSLCSKTSPRSLAWARASPINARPGLPAHPTLRSRKLKQISQNFIELSGKAERQRVVSCRSRVHVSLMSGAATATGRICSLDGCNITLLYRGPS